MIPQVDRKIEIGILRSLVVGSDPLATSKTAVCVLKILHVLCEWKSGNIPDWYSDHFISIHRMREGRKPLLFHSPSTHYPVVAGLDLQIGVSEPEVLKPPLPFPSTIRLVFVQNATRMETRRLEGHGSTLRVPEWSRSTAPVTSASIYLLLSP